MFWICQGKMYHMNPSIFLLQWIVREQSYVISFQKKKAFMKILWNTLCNAIAINLCSVQPCKWGEISNVELTALVKLLCQLLLQSSRNLCIASQNELNLSYFLQLCSWSSSWELLECAKNSILHLGFYVRIYVAVNTERAAGSPTI